MKTPVSVTMLIVGGLLVLAPFLFNSVHEHEIASTFIARPDVMHLNFDVDTALGPVSRFGCWFTGTGLCVVAVIGAAAEARRLPTVPQSAVPAV